MIADKGMLRTLQASRPGRVTLQITLLTAALLSGPSVTFAQDDTAAQSDPPAAGPEEQEGEPQPALALDLSSPRAAMRAFLLAVQEARGDRPERIDDAVACMITSGLEGGDSVERTRRLAHRLHDIIDKRNVILNDIPEATDDTEYVFYQLPADKVEEIEPETQPTPTREIRLALDPKTKRWHFTALTLASIPTLEKAGEKEAEPKAPVDATVPVARSSPRATMESFLSGMNADPKDLALVLSCLNPSGRERLAWEVSGQQLARQLLNVMDKIEVVTLVEIPSRNDGPPYAWYTSKNGNIVIARIEQAKAEDDVWPHSPVKGEWRFTPQTLKTIGALYRELEDKQIVSELRQAGKTEELGLGLRLQRLMPQWSRLKFFTIQLWQYAALVLLLPLGSLVRRLSAYIATLLLRGSLSWRKIDIDREIQQKALHSSGLLVAVLFWQYAIGRLALSPEALDVLLPITQFALALTAIWVGYRFIDILGEHISANEDVKLTHFDDVLIPLMRKILRIVVVLAVILAGFQYYGKTPSTVLGALGIGGLALAFAAQDTLGNFFGSIMVLFDRPFGIGDWVVVGNVEGTVERVGFRSTRVRTFYNSVVTIPNSTTATTLVDNYGARTYRRIRVMLSLTYATKPEKIDAFCEGIRELIRLHPYTRKDYYHVYFNQFSASSLDVLLYCFLQTPDWSTELRERHRLFMDILRLAQRLDVEFAFPTQSIWLKRSQKDGARDELAAKFDGDDPSSIGISEAAKLFDETYGAQAPPPTPVVITTEPHSKRSGPSESQ